MHFFGNIYLLNDYAAILLCGLRGYLLTCWSCLHWFNNTLHFRCYWRSVDVKPMSNFYIYYCNHKCVFIQTWLSWSSCFIIFNRQMENFSKIWYWHLSYIHPLLQVPHVSAMQWVEDLPQITCHGWHSNTVLGFHIFVGCIQQHPDTTCRHWLPISIWMIAIFQR